MKKSYLFLCLFIFCFFQAVNVSADSNIKTFQNEPGLDPALIAEAEAENGELTGVTVQTSYQGYSGSGYVANFANENDQVTVSFTIPDTGLYEIIVRYGGFWGEKTQDLFLNGEHASSVVFPASAEFTTVTGGTYMLNPGENSLSIRKNWGYMAVDKIEVYTAASHLFDIDKNLVDPLAEASARKLYGFLKTQFGERIITGQTRAYFDELSALVGNTPMLKVGDMSAYTEGYPYLWKDGGHTLGATDDGTVADLISWHNSTAGKGLVSLQWHWHSPTGGEAGNNNFYTANTDFDVRQAVIPGTEEYELIIRDIDDIAMQLKRFEDAGVPVLWRPLHEAGGGWFWWGAHGPEPCLELFNIIFERLVVQHELHNLIWVWSTPEADWYPGNQRIDIVGYDSYPGTYNYGAQKYWFDRLYELTGGKKLIAMTENGPVPDPDECFRMEAPWLFFMSWNDLVTAQNEDDHLVSVFSHPSVITLESDNLLWRSALYPDTWYPGFRDAEGRYFHDFSYAGYHQGEAPIPERSEKIINVTQSPYFVDNTGTDDVTTKLQQALDDAGQAGGGVVYLPGGIYRIRESSSTAGANAALHMKYDSVVLRGDGPDQTYIFHDQDELRQKDIIHIRKEWSNWDSGSGSTDIAQDLPGPTRVIPVKSVAGFSIGDLVVLRTDMTAEFAAEHLMEGIWDGTWLDGVMFLRKIDSIDAENDYLVIDIPTRYYMKTRDNARVYHAGGHIRECGIEGLSFGNLENSKSGWDESDYAVPGTGAYDAHYSHVMQFKYALDCWVRNVSTYQPPVNTQDVQVLSNCLLMQMSRNITVDSCFFQKPQYEGGGGNGYMYTLSGNDCLVKNSWANHSRHNYDFKSPFSSGNVILNCRGENSKYSSDFHMYLSMANLIDGFIVDGDYLECAFRPYGGSVIHGYPSTQSVFYNTRGENYHSTKDYIVDSRQFDWGIVTGTSGPADGVKTTPVSGTQNGYAYDTSPEDLVEGEGLGEYLRPVSLYQDQLSRRQSGYRPSIRYYSVALEIKDSYTGEPIEGAEVILNDSTMISGDSGMVHFTHMPEFLTYSASSTGYVPSGEQTAVIQTDTIFRISLAPVLHKVTLKLLDSITHEPFWGVNVTVNNEKRVTDEDGFVYFNLPSGSYAYLIDKVSYHNRSGTLVISSDETFKFYLVRSEAYIKFRLRKEGAPVNKAYVTVGLDSIETNNLGIALFEGLEVNDQYTYAVRKATYESLSGNLFLVTDTTINLEMTKIDTTTNQLGDSYDRSDLQIWPVPALNSVYINVQGFYAGGTLSIVDMHGRMIRRLTITGAETELDIQDLVPGIYSILIHRDHHFDQHFFIKK